MKRYSWIILLISVLILGACQSKKENETENTNGSNNSNEDKEVELLSELEVREMIVENIASMGKEMKELQDEYYEEWFEIIDDRIVDNTEEGSDEVREAVDITMDALADLVTEERREEIAQRHLYNYFRTLEGSAIISPQGQSIAGFEVIDQREDELAVTYISMTTEAGYDLVGRIDVSYEKVDGKWKFAGDGFTLVEDQALALTFDDLSTYYDAEREEMVETEFIDEVEKDGETYLVIKIDDRYEARNVNNSELNLDIANEYEGE